MKSDVLRYQLLWNFGGLYVDVDFECIKPLDILLEKLSFFVGYLHPSFGIKGGGLDKYNLPNNHKNAMNNAVLACSPNHPLLMKMFNHMESRKDKFSLMSWVEAFRCTGPYALHYVLEDVNFLDEHTGIAILPYQILYPESAPGMQRYNFKKVSRDKRFLRSHPEAMAVHHHSCTWL